jgi:hypothetical protein
MWSCAPSQIGCDLEDPVKTAHMSYLQLFEKYRLSHMTSGTAGLNLEFSIIYSNLAESCQALSHSCQALCQSC